MHFKVKDPESCRFPSLPRMKQSAKRGMAVHWWKPSRRSASSFTSAWLDYLDLISPNLEKVLLLVGSSRSQSKQDWLSDRTGNQVSRVNNACR